MRGASGGASQDDPRPADLADLTVALARSRSDNTALRQRLEEAESTLRAIREGEVDAIIVSGLGGDRVFSLSETENLHRQMVETMNEAGLAIAPDGALFYCNARAAALLGRPRHALLGRRLKDFLANGEAERLNALLAATQSGTADDRILFVTDEGAALPLHLWASRLDRPEGPMICLVGTDLRGIEADRALLVRLEAQHQALRASRAEALELMGQAVAAREQAAAAAAALREADQRKDAFLATLSHELRNPLAPIRHALEILRLSAPGAAIRDDALGILERQVNHLVRLVDDLLEVSRITRGKVELRRERVTLAAVVESALEIVRPGLQAAAHHLRVELPAAPVWLEADPVRLAQVFANLLNNAIKFTPAEGRIQVLARVSGDRVEIRVLDNGIGIAVEVLPRLFELFQQAHPDDLAVPPGLGIGLSLARSLVRLHGGEVEAASRGAGRGSEFRVWLPALSAPAAGNPEPPRVEVAREQPSLSILVVDDNRDSADSLAALLRLRGARTRVAYDGATALALVAAEAPDLALLDIAMPGMDGYRLARAIRGGSRGQSMRLIALTGRGSRADRQQSLAAGIDLHLTKPVARATIEAILAAPLDQPLPRELADARESGSAVAVGTGYGEPSVADPRFAAALIHQLAQPLNAASCYALAARTLLNAPTATNRERLEAAILGIDEQLSQASRQLESLRASVRQGAGGDGAWPADAR